MHRGRTLAACSPSPRSHAADKANSFGCGKSQQGPWSKGWSSARCWVTGSQDPSLCSSREPLPSPGSNRARVTGTPKPQGDQNQMMGDTCPLQAAGARPEEPPCTRSLQAGNSAPSSQLTSQKARLSHNPNSALWNRRGGPGWEGTAFRGSAELVLGQEGGCEQAGAPGGWVCVGVCVWVCAAAASRLPLQHRDRDRDPDRDSHAGPGPAPPGPHGRRPLGLSHASRPAP